MSPFILFIKANAREIKFFLSFIFIFFALQTAHYFVKPYVAPFMVDKWTSGVSSNIINAITPYEKTHVHDGAITDGKFTVEIRRGCEGIEGMLMLVAAILSFPAGIRSKCLGIIGGVLLIYIFNLARIVGLYYIIKYKASLFDMMHVYVGQIVIILVAIVFFTLWLNHVEKPGNQRP